jgi:hypothetical protein
MLVDISPTPTTAAAKARMWMQVQTLRLGQRQCMVFRGMLVVLMQMLQLSGLLWRQQTALSKPW